MNAAIMLSGGKGSRTGASLPKQYHKAGGEMMITYALSPLLSSELVDAVVIVAEEEWHEAILREIPDQQRGKLLGFAAPGSNRQRSVLSGLEAVIGSGLCGKMGTIERTLAHAPGEVPDEALVSEDASGLASKGNTVLICDAARPFLSVELLRRLYDALPGHDGVMPYLPMKDTVYLSENGKKISGLLDRGRVVAGQAPELFYLHTYYEATKALLPDAIDRINGSTEPALLYGMDIALVPGDERNVKITTEGDMKSWMESHEWK